MGIERMNKSQEQRLIVNERINGFQYAEDIVLFSSTVANADTYWFLLTESTVLHPHTVCHNRAQ